MKWVAVMVAGLVLVALATAEGEIWEEDDHEVLIRSERGAKSRDPCRYVKGAWSDCDPKTNMRSRILTLKKGDSSTCEQTKTIQKKCKKGKGGSEYKKKRGGACRYEKGAWSECSAQNQMTRSDSLKANSDPSCEQSRQITKKCKNKGAKNSKGNNNPVSTKKIGGRRNNRE